MEAAVLFHTIRMDEAVLAGLHGASVDLEEEEPIVAVSPEQTSHLAGRAVHLQEYLTGPIVIQKRQQGIGRR